MREPEPSTIAAAADGDRRAFAALVGLYQDPVWRFLTRFVGDRDLAEDLTQETFLRVHRGIGGFAGRSRFSTWVFGIARNLALDAARRTGRRPTIVDRGDDELLDDRSQAPSSTVTVELQAALDSLSPAHREAILLVEVLGLTYREVGDLTGTPEGTIKSRVHNARRQLHRWLTADEDAVEPERGADGL